MSENIEKLLTNLHVLVCKELTNRIVSDGASTGDIVAAIRLLKDNGINSTLEASEPLRNLAAEVPFRVVEDIREAK